MERMKKNRYYLVVHSQMKYNYDLSSWDNDLNYATGKLPGEDCPREIIQLPHSFSTSHIYQFPHHFVTLIYHLSHTAVLVLFDQIVNCNTGAQLERSCVKLSLVAF